MNSFNDSLLLIDSPKFGAVLNHVRKLSCEPQDFRVLRSYFSSPRLQDVYLQGFGHSDHVAVGVSFLADNTMLADDDHPTCALDFDYWKSRFAHSTVQVEPGPGVQYVKAQIWSVDPKSLGFNRTAIGVMLSFTERELEDPRLGLAVDELARSLGFTNID